MRPDGRDLSQNDVDVHSSAFLPQVVNGYEPEEPRKTRRINTSHVVLALLLASVVPWRKGVYFDGGVDTVVVAKAAVSVVAFGLAAVHGLGAPRRLGVPAFPILMIVAYLGATVIGGQVNGTLGPAVVVAVRVLIVCLAMTFLMIRYAPMDVLGSLIQVVGLVVTAAVITGLPSAAHGRLAGGLPPLDPNELALMAGVCFLWAFSSMLTGRESTTELVLAGAFLAVVILSGSRSGLAALTLAVVVMTCRATAMTRRSFALVCLLGPVLAYVVFGTDLLSSLLLRGGEQGVLTLSNRTIAWDAALTSDRDPWDALFGAGLTQKHVEVHGQWWTSQLLDSSWISAIVQSGLVGTVLVVILAVSTTLRSLALARRYGPFLLGCATFLCFRGLLESGLFDATTTFIFFFATALACRSSPNPPGVSGRELQRTQRIPDTVAPYG